MRGLKEAAAYRVKRFVNGSVFDSRDGARSTLGNVNVYHSGVHCLSQYVARKSGVVKGAISFETLKLITKVVLVQDRTERIIIVNRTQDTI